MTHLYINNFRSDSSLACVLWVYMTFQTTLYPIKYIIITSILMQWVCTMIHVDIIMIHNLKQWVYA